MKILANRRNTGLSDSYILETSSTRLGVIVTVYSMEKQILGQFTNNRQACGDKRDLENIVIYDKRFNEVLDYFNKVG